jgi:hypothetical protein
MRSHWHNPNVPGVEPLKEIHMPSHRLLLIALAALTAPILAAQTVRQSSEQKTIEISATEKVSVTAEVATIKIGFQNQAATKDAAYAENTASANKILQALIDAGVPKEAVETETLNLGQDQERYGPNSNRSTKFTASQQWQIRSKASEAQKIVDVAVAAGANQIEQVDWSVADDKQLEARAYASALRRAKELAEQTAQQSGVKLGEIISIANAAYPAGRLALAGKRDLEMYAYVSTPPKVAVLHLQPGTVEREASVTVTYAIAP